MSDRMSVAEYRQAVRDAWSHDEFVTEVIRLFQENGWKCRAIFPARVGKKIITPIKGDAGEPDILAAKDGWVVFAELKVGRDRVKPHQQEWIDALLGTLVPYTGTEPWFELASVGEHMTFVWRPSDFNVIERIARGE